jgi:hypothetical protein
MRTVTWIVLLAACGGGSNAPDAGDEDAADAGADAFEDFVDAEPGACVPATVFLNFEGVTINRGFEDAAANTTPWPMDGVTPATIPPFLDGDGERDTRIAAIVAQIEATLAPFDITLVTERPGSGLYDMIFFGGDPTDMGYTATQVFALQYDCDGTENASSIGAIFEGGQGDVASANAAIMIIGGTHGVAPTSDVPTDCMCVECIPTDTPCTLATDATVWEPHQLICGALVMQDTAATFAARMCSAP